VTRTPASSSPAISPAASPAWSPAWPRGSSSRSVGAAESATGAARPAAAAAAAAEMAMLAAEQVCTALQGELKGWGGGEEGAGPARVCVCVSARGCPFLLSLPLPRTGGASVPSQNTDDQ
jgi:hypothetical protein